MAWKLNKSSFSLLNKFFSSFQILIFLCQATQGDHIRLLHRGAFFQFFSGGFITAIVVKSPEKKLARRTSVYCISLNSVQKNLVVFGVVDMFLLTKCLFLIASLFSQNNILRNNQVLLVSNIKSSHHSFFLFPYLSNRCIK